MKDKLWRLWWRIKNLSGPYHELNRRAEVESEMWGSVKKGTPVEVAKIREWAVRLGVPKEFQRK